MSGHPVRGTLGTWVLWLVLLMVSMPLRAEWIRLEDARALTLVDSRVSSSDVKLPYAWDAHFTGRSGQATFAMVFELPSAPRGPQALHTRRLGNAYEIWLNGVLVDQHGAVNQPNTSDISHVPRFVPLPAGLLRTHNELVIHIRADAMRSAGLTPVTIGDAAQVRDIFNTDHWWRVTGAQVVLSVSLVSAGLSLALWLTQYRFEPQADRRVRRRRDSVYLLVAMADVFWSLRVGDVLIENPPVPWPAWGLVPAFALSAWAVCIGTFCVAVGVWGRIQVQTWPRWLFWVSLLAGLPIAAIALVAGVPWLLQLWYAVIGVAFLVVGALFGVQAFRRGSDLTHRLVALAMIINAIAGLRDLLVFYISPAYGEYTYLRYTSLLFGVSLALFVVNRFKIANDRNLELMETLTQRVAEREAELTESYRRLEELAREQERVAERSRILRDMHDGVGSHISAALRQLQSGRSTSDELQHTLRDALDQLKLSIDAINLPAGDVAALLANLRYRLQPRFAALDIELRWEVDELPLVASLSHHDMRQLQYMLFEAISNVLQHAQCHEMRLQALVSQGDVVLRVVDDGVGFDIRAPSGNGLVSLRQRAEAIGAALHVSSEAGRTAVEIRLR
jgi:hypothetical protein